MVEHLLVRTTDFPGHGEEDQALPWGERLAERADTVQVAVARGTTCVPGRRDVLVETARAELALDLHGALFCEGLPFFLAVGQGFAREVKLPRSAGVQTDDAHELLAEPCLASVPAHVGAIGGCLAERAHRRG